MKQIGTFRPPIGCDEQTAFDSRRAAQVWLRMTELFGKRWTDNNGTTPPLSWVRAIEQLSDDQIREGLGRILHSGAKHPPPLPEFVEFCEPKNTPVECRVNPQAYKLLPLDPPETDEQKADRLARGREEIAKVRAKLRGQA